MSRKAPKYKSNPKMPLNKNQQLFCHYYVQNTQLRGNATRAYAAAYGYDLESCSKDDAVYEQTEDGTTGKMLKWSTYSRVENLCASNASTLQRNPKIQALQVKLWNSLLTDEVVDSQLAKVVLDEDRSTSLAGVREYNKLKGRIINKQALTDAAGKILPVLGLTIHAPETTDD